MTSDRDQLAELIGSVRADEPDPLTYCDCPDPQQIADAILAAGWRPPETCDHVWLRPLESRRWGQDPDTCGRCGQSRGRDLHR